MRRYDFEGAELLCTVIGIIAAAAFCGVGAFFIKVDVFSKLNPDYPPAKRIRHFHKKFGIAFIIFALVWLIVFLAGINQ